ncbi:50S ribosomal protein L17 [bacterium HR21]|uniref:Large ribosomal subunit protein bL17 n=1 Tax=uncultured Chlorobiota bacterium TaxID=156405 RepID=H5SGM7_9BACT|nr:50S ribosomal protein L17 [uncultured Chlorobiota bacterium]GBD06691.1 50S ribosomal protein L17 [bacterium HR21]
MRHRDKVKKLKRTRSHRKALLCHLATALILHKRIVTTEAKAKALRPFVERLITRARKAVLRERSGQLPAGWSVDLHQRRFVGRFIRDTKALQELFGTIAPKVLERPGGYTRVVKLGLYRRGDGARMAMIELVDWAALAETAPHQTETVTAS